MSDQDKAKLTIDTPKLDTDQADLSPSTNGFVLNSPSNSGLKTNSEGLKKTKYQKLVKLYKELLEKKKKIDVKQQEIKSLRDLIKPKTEENYQSQKPSQKTSQVQLLKIQIIQEEQKGQARSKQLLKSIYELDSQINKNKADHSSQIATLQRKLQQTINNFNKLSNEEHPKQTKQLQASKKNLTKLEQAIKNKNLASEAQIKTLNSKKLDLENKIKSVKQDIIKFATENQRLLKKQSNQQVSGSSVDLETKLTTYRKQLQQLKKKSQQDQKKLKQISKKLKKQKEAEQKFSKTLTNLTKQVADSEVSLKKATKQQEDKRKRVQKNKDQYKQKQGSEQMVKARARNDKLKIQLDKVKKDYQDEQNVADNLVPPHIIENLQKQVQQQKVKYALNKQLPDKLKKVEKQITQLKNKKEELTWGEQNPQLHKLQQQKKKEQTQAARYEQQIKLKTRQQQQVSKILDQYIKQYPQFETKKLNAKKAAAAKKQKQRQQARKLEQAAAKTNKKKKGKAQQKSPQPQPEPPKVQKSQKKQAPPSPVKIQKKQTSKTIQTKPSQNKKKPK